MQFYALSFHIFIFPTTHFSSFPLQLVVMAAIGIQEWQVELGGAGKKTLCWQPGGLRGIDSSYDLYPGFYRWLRVEHFNQRLKHELNSKSSG